LKEIAKQNILMSKGMRRFPLEEKNILKLVLFSSMSVVVIESPNSGIHNVRE
jgi:hypothetical protein